MGQAEGGAAPRPAFPSQRGPGIGADSGGVGKRGLAGRDKMKPAPEQEEGARKQTFEEISFP